MRKEEDGEGKRRKKKQHWYFTVPLVLPSNVVSL